MLPGYLNKITNSFYNSNDSDLLIKDQQNTSFVYPKGNISKNLKWASDNAFNRPLTQINSDTITSLNPFSPLQNYELSKSRDNNNENTTNFECNSSANSTIKRISPNKRPPVVINQFPENQTDFTRLRTVPDEKPYSNTVKSRFKCHIKIFSHSIRRVIRMRDFNKFVRFGKEKLQCFLGATSKQLLHYLDVNLQDKIAESVILHVGVNDVLQDSRETNTYSFFNNVKKMAKKYRSYNKKNVFITGPNFLKDLISTLVTLLIF